MSTVERRPETGRGREPPLAPAVAPPAQTSPTPLPRRRRRFRVLPFLATLIVLGIAGFVGTGREHPTALIPSYFGIVFLVLGFVSRNASIRIRST